MNEKLKGSGQLKARKVELATHYRDSGRTSSGVRKTVARLLKDSYNSLFPAGSSREKTVNVEHHLAMGQWLNSDAGKKQLELHAALSPAQHILGFGLQISVTASLTSDLSLLAH